MGQTNRQPVMVGPTPAKDASSQLDNCKSGDCCVVSQLLGSPGRGRGGHGLPAKEVRMKLGRMESGFGWRKRVAHRPFLRSSLTKEANTTPMLAVHQGWRGAEGRISLVEPLRFLTRRQKNARRFARHSPEVEREVSPTHPDTAAPSIRHRRHQFPREWEVPQLLTPTRH